MKPGILLAGNFLSGHGRKRGVSEDLADRLERRGWSIVRTSSVLSRPLRLADMVSAVWIHSRRYAVAHVDVFSGPAFLWAEAVCASLSCLRRPYVLTLHGGALPQFAELSPKRVRRLLASAVEVTTPSRFLARQMAGFRSAVVMPNAVELNSYPAHSPGRRMKPKLVWLRSFHRIYNPQMAVEVLALLRPDFPDAELIMIGPDDRDGTLEATRQFARELGVAGAIQFAGPISKSEVPRRLAEADIFLNTTTIDNAPVSLIEAMACGLPVVTTDVGGIPDLIEPERNGLLVPSGDAKAMTARIRDLLGSPEAAMRISECGRQTAFRHDWSTILPRWEDLFSSVAPVQRS